MAGMQIQEPRRMNVMLNFPTFTLRGKIPVNELPALLRAAGEMRLKPQKKLRGKKASRQT